MKVINDRQNMSSVVFVADVCDLLRPSDVDIDALSVIVELRDHERMLVSTKVMSGLISIYDSM